MPIETTSISDLIGEALLLFEGSFHALSNSRSFDSLSQGVKFPMLRINLQADGLKFSMLLFLANSEMLYLAS